MFRRASPRSGCYPSAAARSFHGWLQLATPLGPPAPPHAEAARRCGLLRLLPTAAAPGTLPRNLIGRLGPRVLACELGRAHCASDGTVYAPGAHPWSSLRASELRDTAGERLASGARGPRATCASLVCIACPRARLWLCVVRAASSCQHSARRERPPGCGDSAFAIPALGILQMKMYSSTVLTAV